MSAETLKTLLKKIKDILAEVLEANRCLEEAVKNAEAYPGAEYQVIEVSMQEIGTPKIATVKVQGVRR